MRSPRNNSFWALAPLKRPIPVRLALALSTLTVLVVSMTALLICDVFTLHA